MKKVVLALLAMVILSACSFQDTPPSISDANESAQSSKITMLDEGVCETDYNDYMELLKQEGFSVIEDISEEIKGQDYISVGTLLSNGEKGLSISYISNSFTIYISFVK